MFFFSSFRCSALWMCPFVCGRKTIDFSVVVVQTGRAQKCGGGGGARKKDEENRVACTLSRARSQNSFARVRRDPSGFSVFRKGDWDERQRINFVHRRDLSSSCLVSSKSLPGRTKEEEKRALIYAKENESTTKTHETPSFFFGTKTNNRPSSRPRRWLQPPSSPRKRPTRRKTSSRKSPKANRFWSTSPGARFCPPFRSRWRSSCGDDRACKREREEK